MKFTLSWLKDHLDTDASLDAITERLTSLGLEVEHVDAGAALRPFRIAKVLTAVRHPDADKLQVLSVDAGPDINEGRPVQVVCGAPNARAGLLGVLAPPGAFVPGIDTTIGVGRIRGVESFGMMCSERELQLSGEHNGIIDLAGDAPVGQSFADYAGLADPVIEIGLTPNRPDATGIAGIARDLAASGLGQLRTPPVERIEGEGECPVKVLIESEICQGFALRLIRGVRNAASPDWLQKRLKAIGLRPINALVDVTNYVTFDRGRPLHVFDANKVAGDLVVRRAREGEALLGLDGRTHRLTAAMSVIADRNGPESIAGIMGGEHTGCDENTVDVLVESAMWEPLEVARTGRALGVITDARYRFERGVDPALTEPGLDLATRMILDLCGGTPTRRVVEGLRPAERRSIALPFTEVCRLTGLDIPADRQTAILTELGFTVEAEGEKSARVSPPTWRPDIEGKADLVEEVMRLVGVDRIEPRPLFMANAVNGRILTPAQTRGRSVRRALAARGMSETVTYSFVSAEAARLFGGGSEALALENPIAADLSDMRPSLLPSLLAAAVRNGARGISDTALFEVSHIYRSDAPDGQRRVAGGLRRGSAHPDGAGRFWDADAQPVSVFDAKADALAALEAAGAPTDRCQVEAPASSWYHPGRSGRLRLGAKVLAEFGELHPATLKAMDASGTFAGFEVFLDEVPEPRRKPTKTRPVLSLSPFQPVRRDFAFVVGTDVPALSLVRAAEGADKALVGEVRVFDVFAGSALGEGRKSVALEVTLRPAERTLTDEDLEAVSNRIVLAVEKASGGTLRS